MPVCAGECKQEVPLSAGVWLSRPLKDEKGRVKKIGSKVAKEKVFFCRTDSIAELTPDMEKGDQFIIRLWNTWHRIVPLSDLVSYDLDKDEREGRLLIAWFVHGRGDVTRAVSMMRQIEAEMKYRISRDAMFRELFGGLFSGATQVRQIAVRQQLNALLEVFRAAREALAEIEAAKKQDVEIPTGPGIEFQRASKEIYRLLRTILNEIGNAYLGKLKEGLNPRARSVLFNIKGRAFAQEGEVVEETPSGETEELEREVEIAAAEEVVAPAVEEAEAPPGEAPDERSGDAAAEPVQTPSEAIFGLPDKERTIFERSTKPAQRKEQARAEQIMTDYLRAGGTFFPDDAMSRIKAAADNGGTLGDIRVTRGKKREKKEREAK